MVEFVTEAIVVDKDPWRERDARVFLYTHTLGLVAAKATSARAPRAKLNAHLEPLNIIMVRLAQRQENESALFQISDALVVDHCGSWRDTSDHLACGLEIAQFLRQQQIGDADEEVWELAKNTLQSPPRRTAGEYKKELLGAMGFSPTHATCAVCSAGSIAAFDFGSAIFYCSGCFKLAEPSDSVSVIE